MSAGAGRAGRPGPAAGPPDPAELAGALAPWAGAGARVENLALLPGGASQQTWSFDAVSAGGARLGLILRRSPPGRPAGRAVTGREAAALSLAHGAGLPVPEMLFCSDGAGTGTPGMVMRRIAGETIARKILRDDAYAPARGVLTGQLAEFAAGLHALSAPADFPRPDPLGELAAQLDWFAAAPSAQRSPAFELALDWLAARRPPARDPVLVHGDFRLGNLIVGPEGLRAVLDWELTHAGSPAEDLGWLCVKAWRFGAAPPAAGLGSREALLAAYRAAGGADISPGELRWWEILGMLRWGVICLSQAWAHLSGAHRSVELAAIGRRACEQEWDLLLALEPDAARRAAAARPRLPDSPAGGPGPAPLGRPSAAELLEAVREYLLGSVLPQTSGQLSFHARVAAGVLAVVSRELQLGPPPPGAGLAGQVAARLAVANPGYFDSPPP